MGNKFIVTPNQPKKFLKRQGDGMVGPLQLASLTTTQRDAIASPATGMLIWNSTTGAINEYNGSSWAAVGGGASSPLTTKGDLYGYSSADARIPVGADNTVLTADSAEALGVKWAVPAGGGDVSKVGTPVDSQIGVWTGDGTIEGAASLTYDGSNLQLTGDIGSTGTRITKGWFTDLQVTNAISGGVTGNAGTVTNATLTTALTVDTGALTLTANADNSSVLTIGSGAVSVSGSNTGDNTVCTSGTATTAETLATARAIYGNDFNGSAALTQVIASTYGGTGNGFTKFTGPTTAEKTFTLPDSSSTLLYDGGALGTPSSGTLTNATGLPLTGLVDDTTTALGVGTLELGHASDTTLSRASAGVLAVEGVNVLTTAGGTLTGNINLGEAQDPADRGIVMDSSLSADERYSGITIPGTAGATISFGDLCYLDATAGEWLLADSSAVGTAGTVPVGICVDASTDGNATSMLMLGTVRSAAFPASVALGAPLYISETAGDITATAPTTADAVVRVVAFAITTEPNTFYFNPSMDHITVTG